MILKDTWKILKNNIPCVIMMIVIISINFYLLGISLTSKSITNKAAQSYEETYGNKTLYYTGEYLSDDTFYHYREESNTEELDRLKNFTSKLLNCDDFSFVSISTQPIDVIDTKIPDIFLFNYEVGSYDQSISQNGNETHYLSKTVACSQSFFDAFSLEIDTGRAFTEEDFTVNLSEKQNIPVILGNEYKSFFHLGEQFDAAYLNEQFHFVIVGFLKENSFFFDKSVADMVPCNRYILIPAFYTDSYDDFSKIMTLQRTTGVIFSSIGYEETTSKFKQYQNEAGLSYWDLYCSYPNGNNDTTNIFQTYSAMTSEVSNQFRIIVILILFFSSISITTMICNMLRENRTNFGIELLCGSSLKRISAQAFLMISFIILIGDILALSAMFNGNIGIKAFVTVQMTAILITVVVGTICAIYAKKMDLSSIIGGKE